MPSVHRWNLRNTPDFCHIFLQLKRQSERVLALTLLDQVLHQWRASDRAGAVALGCWCPAGIRKKGFSSPKAAPGRGSGLALGALWLCWMCHSVTVTHSHLQEPL